MAILQVLDFFLLSILGVKVSTEKTKKWGDYVAYLKLHGYLVTHSKICVPFSGPSFINLKSSLNCE